MSNVPDPHPGLPATSSDPDWQRLAKPGHGIPAEDPDPAAQVPIEPERAEDEQKTVYMGGGIMAGAAAGAAVGTAVAGPVGTFVGTIGGAVAGALGGAAVGAVMPADDEKPLQAEPGEPVADDLDRGRAPPG